MKIKLLLEKSKYSKKQLQALALLEESEELAGEITAVRKQFGVPTGGYSVQLSQEGKVLNPDDVSNAVNQSLPWIDQAVKDIIWLFDLPIGWHGTLVGIILFQSAPPPDIDEETMPISIEYSGVVGLDDVLKKAQKQLKHKPKATNSLTITVSEKMSFKQLVAELNKNKPLIDRYLSDLPSTPNLSRTKDLEIKKEILELTKDGKTDREIADFFLEKYPNKTTFHDETVISLYRNRFKAHLAKLPKRLKLRQLMKTMRLPNT
ncbi:MAG: hypothetical protein UT13_C0001G0307 [Candidatus Pacebacteria bacterium GW2011_GWF2_38_9]|nr:MAG: hypothetical protein US01_C0001G0315 [candidate division TM6 bacterium GW2011_GWF2_28_16]KKQ10296.1 MAG: hypothetical protein US20_C0001G0010 [Candidatus Pacebacteria bacterium GW2011_GWF1_36_5]KKQ88660.1 MAG: hypothetical protein UT13_C0001G0307 [Candidatus Pacebacteria bacterium GW2011_GWF2_38_9]HAZ73694.1 hypothetical protein [Candidatus Paceibacterota bacterium]